MKKRFVAVLLTATLVLGSSMSAWAAEEGTLENEVEDVTEEEVSVLENDEEAKAVDILDTEADDATSFVREDQNGLTWKAEDGALTISGKEEIGKGWDYKRVVTNTEGITSVTIEEGIPSISPVMFLSWEKLEKVTLPSTVASIGYEAFAGCTSLPEITIPSGVKEIGNGAFTGCESLKTITFKGDAPEVRNSIFEGVTATAYYPAGNETYTEEVKDGYGGNLTWVEQALELPFTDVGEGWYKDAVDYVYAKGIMTGMNETEFGLTVRLPRSHFATIIYRLAEEPDAVFEGDAFKDVPDGQFYTLAAMWAKSKGIIVGYEDGTFGADDPITREQIATMMYRYANVQGLDLTAEGDLSSFPDADKVSDFAEKAMAWAVGKGLIKGEADGKVLNPVGYADRAQCATIIKRFIDAYKL